MKNIEVDDELYHYIASKTEKIGEPASAILRRLLGFDDAAEKKPVQATAQPEPVPEPAPEPTPEPVLEPVAAVQEEVVAQVQVEPQATPEAQAESAPEVEVADNTPSEPVEAVEPAVEPHPEEVKVEVAEAAPKAKKPRKIAPRKLSAAEQKEAEEVAKLVPSGKLQDLALNDLQTQHGAVGRFLYILSALEQQHADAFSGVVQIKGRDRLYFADNEEQLRQSGSSTNPKRIGKTSYWVITNNNTSRKKWMLKEVAKMLGYGESDLRILADKI